MEPTYNPRDWLLVYYGFFGKKNLSLRTGGAVVIEREQQPGIFYIKRITEIQSDSAGRKSYYVSSDNSAGTDSRNWGYLRRDEIVGRVVTRIKKS